MLERCTWYHHTVWVRRRAGDKKEERNEKSPPTGVADWTGRASLEVRAIVSNRTIRSPLRSETPATFRAKRG